MTFFSFLFSYTLFGEEKMRKFYIFQIKNEYQELYKYHPKSLYHIFKYLYFLKKKDSCYGVELFDQLVKAIDKNKLNRKVFIKYHKERTYSKVKNIHVINDLYKDEISTINIKNSYILLESNHNTSAFFKILLEEEKNLFVCDFINQDYFWLSDMKTLV